MSPFRTKLWSTISLASIVAISDASGISAVFPAANTWSIRSGYELLKFFYTEAFDWSMKHSIRIWTLEVFFILKHSTRCLIFSWSKNYKPQSRLMGVLITYLENRVFLILNWLFFNCLENRTQFVCVDADSSYVLAFTIGVAQVYLLGSLLFCIFINEVLTFSDPFIFVDDLKFLVKKAFG